MWYRFIAADNTHFFPTAVLAGGALTTEWLSGACGSLTSIACNSAFETGLTPGAQYCIRCVDETCLGPVLLENPSIEQGVNCWPYLPEVDDTGGLGTLITPGWPRMQSGSSDSFSSCANYDTFQEVPASWVDGSDLLRVHARSGKGMAGIVVKEGVDYTEYIQAPLTEPLIPGEPYLVSFHAATRPGAQLCVNGLGAVLSRGPIAFQDVTVLPVEPHVISQEVICSDQWVTVCGVVIPDEAVDHITIGSFYTRNEISYNGDLLDRAYYFIDDVVVARVSDPGCITGLGDAPPSDEGAQSEQSEGLRVYPNPASDRVHIVCDASLFGQRGVIEVFDVTGKRVHAEQVASLNALQQLDLSNEWKEGVYLVRVRVEGQPPRSARVVLKR